MPHSGKPTRREFLVTTSSAALSAAVPLPQASVPSASEPSRAATLGPYSHEALLKPGPQRAFQGDRTTQVAMPIGGIGAGCICLNGYGGLQDFSIWNRPATTALPEGLRPFKGGLRYPSCQRHKTHHEARGRPIPCVKDLRPRAPR